MKPTISQLFYNPEFFIQKYKEAGMINAAERITGILRWVIDYMSVRRHYNSVIRNKNSIYRFIERSKKDEVRGNMDSYYRRDRRNKKSQIVSLDRTASFYLAHMRKLEALWIKKTASWPEIEFDPQKLNKRGTVEFIRNFQLKRRWRSRKTLLEM